MRRRRVAMLFGAAAGLIICLLIRLDVLPLPMRREYGLLVFGLFMLAGGLTLELWLMERKR